MCVWKDENKWKRGRGWPNFLKKNKIKDAEISDNFFGLTVVNLVGKWSKILKIITIELYYRLAIL